MANVVREIYGKIRNKVYHVLRKGAKTITADNRYETKEKDISGLKLFNFTAYIELIIALLSLKKHRQKLISTETQD